jgi:hypothetical protein
MAKILAATTRKIGATSALTLRPVAEAAAKLLDFVEQPPRCGAAARRN